MTTMFWKQTLIPTKRMLMKEAEVQVVVPRGRAGYTARPLGCPSAQGEWQPRLTIPGR